MSETIFYRFVVKRDLAAALAAADTLLLEGEFGLETDTGLLKIGDGITAWTDLPYNVNIQTQAQIRAALDLLGISNEGDLVYKGAAGWTLLSAGADGQVIKLVAGYPAWANETGGGGSSFDHTTEAEIVPFDDMMVTPATGYGNWVVNIGGAGSVGAVAEAANPGICRLTASGTTGNASIAYGNSNTLLLGGGETWVEARVRWTHISTVPETVYAQTLGFMDLWNGSATNRVYAAYPSPGGSLIMFCRKAGVDTTANASTVIVAGVWYVLKVVVNADATQAQLYIDNVLEATVTASLPTVALRPGMLVGKSSGSAARGLDVDWIRSGITLTTPRS